LAPPPGRLPVLATDDVLLRRAWAQAGSSTSPMPDSFDAWSAEGRSNGCLALSLSELDPDPRAALESFEARWLAQIAAATASGQGGQVSIYLGGTVLEFSRIDLLRFWRRPRAWQEALR